MKTPIQSIRKVLVANRGEIALRIMKTAREMGITTVAVYSEADSDSPFARFADEAVCIGPPPSSESYLLGARIIEVALELGVDAIHPGYGFLSENPEFSKNVRKRRDDFHWSIGTGHDDDGLQIGRERKRQAI